MRCQTHGNIEQFEKVMIPLEEWLQKTTSYEIKEAICSHMRAYQRSNYVNGNNINLLNVSGHQDTLGIRAFGEGFLSYGWREVQESYYGGNDSQQKSERWVSTLITKIWEVSWEMWQARNDILHNDKEV